MHRIRLPLQHLWLFPFVAGTAWFVTLAVLLITWFAKGMPKYPMQSNPNVAFISDIAAFTLKPFFLTGVSITGISYVATVVLVHFSRYDQQMYGVDDVRWKKNLSLVAMAFGIIAGTALILLAIMDTARSHEEHRWLLLACLLGIVGSAVGTTVVYWDQVWKPSVFRNLRFYATMSAVAVLTDFGLGVAFYYFMSVGYWRIAGILEWVMAFVGAFYIWAFVGFVSVPEDGIDDGEREALLRSEEEGT